MSISTTLGDDGTTGLFGGARLPKDHPHIEALGALDELTAFLGDAKCTAAHPRTREILDTVQREIFIVMGILADFNPTDFNPTARIGTDSITVPDTGTMDNEAVDQKRGTKCGDSSFAAGDSCNDLAMIREAAGTAGSAGEGVECAVDCDEGSVTTDGSKRAAVPDESRLTAWVRELEAARPVRGFVVPGGCPASAKLDIARTVCRRAERRLITLGRTETVRGDVHRYLNRLSDLLFMLAREEDQ